MFFIKLYRPLIIYRSEAKSGTNSFYAYATLYVISNNKRVTLAIRGVRQLDTSVALITYLLAELEPLKINVKKLYLDRGFFNTPVIRWLQALDIPFLMPAIKTGKKGGIKQFLKGKKVIKLPIPLQETKMISSHLIYGLSVNIERESIKSMEFNTLFMLLIRSKQI